MIGYQSEKMSRKRA